jgi:hypothetical protein
MRTLAQARIKRESAVELLAPEIAAALATVRTPRDRRAVRELSWTHPGG